MTSIEKITFKDKKVLIRVDFNLPITDEGIIIDDRRIRATLPTIQKVIQDGGIAILLAHLGRPKNGYEKRYSLINIVPTLSSLLHQSVIFLPSCIGQSVKEQIKSLAAGSVILLENVRFSKEETVGDTCFAQALAELADAYINDAFGTIHRNHVSISLLPTYFKERYTGYLLEQEIAAINKIFCKDQSPLVVIMGGNKLVDKAKPIEGLMRHVDHILISGGLILPFFYAKHITALADAYDPAVAIAGELFDKMSQQDNHCHLWLPTDVVTVPDKGTNGCQSILPLFDIACGSYSIEDIGPATRVHFTELIAKAKTILWAGPVGIFESGRSIAGTLAIAEAISKATKRGAYSIVGGGDTAAAIKKIGYENHFSHISTGGGALLAYISANRKLPSLEVLNR